MHRNHVVMRKDFHTLRQGEWLNDEVINFYVQLIQVGVDCGCVHACMHACVCVSVCMHARMRACECVHASPYASFARFLFFVSVCVGAWAHGGSVVNEYGKLRYR